MLSGVRWAGRGVLAVVLSLPLATFAAEESVDVEKALEALLPSAGTESVRRERVRGSTPQPRVCARYARQIVHYTKLAERAEELGDPVQEERMVLQVQQLERRAGSKCSGLDFLIDTASDPEAIAGSHICTRYAFQIARYEEMAERVDGFRAGAGNGDLWRKNTLAHSKRLRANAAAVCPELEDDAIKKAREFAKLVKLAASAALSYLTFGAYPF